MSPILEKIQEETLPIFKHWGVKRASIFGSYARDEAGKSSDVDFVVEFEGKKSLLDLSGLKIDLEEKLKRSVDVLTYNSIHPAIREKVLKDQKRIL